MATNFMKSPSLLFTSESVTEGHPDKLCDQVSDAVLDAFLRIDPRARVACETATTTGLVVVMGEVTDDGYVDVQELVRQTVREKLPEGFQRSEFLLDHGAIDMIVHRHKLRERIGGLINKFMPVAHVLRQGGRALGSSGRGMDVMPRGK